MSTQLTQTRQSLVNMRRKLAQRGWLKPAEINYIYQLEQREAQLWEAVNATPAVRLTDQYFGRQFELDKLKPKYEAMGAELRSLALATWSESERLYIYPDGTRSSTLSPQEQFVALEVYANRLLAAISV